MKLCRTYFLSLLPIILLPGCSFVSSDDSGSSSKLTEKLIGKTWELRSVKENGYGIYATERDSMYSITFHSDSGFSAFDICNNCGGSYQIDNNEIISFEGFFCTEIACSGYQNAIPFSSLLAGNTYPISIQNEELHITVDEDNGAERDYVFAEYSSIKKAIMANPTTFNKDDWPSGYHNVLESDIIDDTLHLRIGYSGCGTHELNLVFYNYFMESYPVQAYAMISHPEEPCDAYFESKESIDLIPLKNEYQVYYSEEGVIDISIFRQYTKEIMLRYNF